LIASTDGKVIGKICPQSIPYRVGGMCEEDEHYKETRQKYTTRKKFKRKYREYLQDGMSEKISLTSEVGDISYLEITFDL
jgi:hypothetical protein